MYVAFTLNLFCFLFTLRDRNWSWKQGKKKFDEINQNYFYLVAHWNSLILIVIFFFSGIFFGKIFKCYFILFVWNARIFMYRTAYTMCVASLICAYSSEVLIILKKTQVTKLHFAHNRKMLTKRISHGYSNFVCVCVCVLNFILIFILAVVTDAH